MGLGTRFDPWVIEVPVGVVGGLLDELVVYIRLHEACTGYRRLQEPLPSRSLPQCDFYSNVCMSTRYRYTVCTCYVLVHVQCRYMYVYYMYYMYTVICQMGTVVTTELIAEMVEKKWQNLSQNRAEKLYNFLWPKKCSDAGPHYVFDDCIHTVR